MLSPTPSKHPSIVTTKDNLPTHFICLGGFERKTPLSLLSESNRKFLMSLTLLMGCSNISFPTLLSDMTYFVPYSYHEFRSITIRLLYKWQPTDFSQKLITRITQSLLQLVSIPQLLLESGFLSIIVANSADAALWCRHKHSVRWRDVDGVMTATATPTALIRTLPIMTSLVVFIYS